MLILKRTDYYDRSFFYKKVKKRRIDCGAKCNVLTKVRFESRSHQRVEIQAVRPDMQ